MYKWTLVNDQAPFGPRDGAGALVYDDAMWLVGGWNPSDKENFPLICNNEVWRSVDGAGWDLVKPNSFKDENFDFSRDWAGRHTAGYVVHDNAMWIIGGDANQGYYQNDIWRSTNGKSWSCINDDVPWGPRILHYTVAFRDRIWIMGGQTAPEFAPADEIFYEDVWSSADGVSWNQIIPEGNHWITRGMIGGSAVFQDRIWMLGGGTYDTPDTPERTFYNEVWSTEDGKSWICHTKQAAWHPRQYHEVAVFDNKLWVLEGWNQSNRNDVWYSSDGVEWTEVPDTPWAPRHAASVFVFRDALWMVAGNNMTSDVWILEEI